MIESQTPMFEDLPVTDPKVRKENPFQAQIVTIMNERNIKDADVIKATGIPWGTWMGWVYGEVDSPIAGENLKKIFKFFNVHVEFLLWGIGTDEPAVLEFEKKTEESA